MDIVTDSLEVQQVRAPVVAAHDGDPPGGGLPPGRAMAVARRGRARTEKEMARANILNYL
jgi:hypothetical protein